MLLCSIVHPVIILAARIKIIDGNDDDEKKKTKMQKMHNVNTCNPNPVYRLVFFFSFILWLFIIKGIYNTINV